MDTYINVAGTYQKAKAISIKDGGGGNLGRGANITIGPYAYGGSGGAAGYYAVGNSYITWVVPGDRRGNVS